ncbi:PASTA domain-containing protein [Flammeovirga aprica]|uniref:PASTA domain-containing protein n=1 Tax=Flammeovirga aprica JL-4 TaxID=694437 RepID=A0A7X9P2W0_9BACT|nr:PASTA domain-containing protein [Flammeovirga aprica]NME67407.1 PASTA domain-containing protein [Flammeovirga aprica JL-4]
MDQDKLKKLIFGDTPSALFINVVLMIVATVLLAIMFFYLYLPAATKHGQTVTVPDIDSLSIDDATKRLESAGLRYEVFDSAPVNYNPDLPYLTVLSQTPLSGEKVKDNRKIYLTVNPSKPAAIKLPDLIDGSLKNAVVRIKNLGLKIGSIDRKPDQFVNNVLEVKYKGKSISKDVLKSGFKVLKGDTIDLVVGDGMGNPLTKVPNLIGMTEGDAEFTLYGLGLGVGSVKYVQYDTIPGVVVRQSPHAKPNEETGRHPKIRLGRTVNLWVSEFSGNKK